MSDFEDDMDVDAPAVHDTVMFSSDNTTKGKRSAANLPVEAEDSLPWYACASFTFWVDLMGGIG
jgi:replication factor C subunit 3/5